MFLLEGTVVFSASDLVRAAACEFAVMRGLDAALGLIDAPTPAADPMVERTAKLGGAHERRQFAVFEERFADGVVTIGRPERTRAGLDAAARATVEAVAAGHEVVYQGAFFDGRFLGYSDFLVKQDDGYAVYDTKLSRHARVTALLQLAAYADALERNGVRAAPYAHLLLGDGTTSSHLVADIVPVYAQRRDSLQAMIDDHHHALIPVRWGDGRYMACGRCEMCEPEVEAARDLLLVAGMRATQRARLIDGGVGTIDALAARTAPVPGMSRRTVGTLRAQAAAQLRQEEQTGEPFVEVFAPDVLAALPVPDAGDIFFDFEGDPLWAEDGSTDWGLEYLFGVVEGPAQTPRFRPFWAHSRLEERQALIDFLDYVAARRREYPNMHIYHYAAYEKTALLRLAGRYGVGEDTVDDLLRHGVLVDLYPVVRSAIRIGQPSYSIKKLEPLYMDVRNGDVKDAAASIVAYADYCDLRDDAKTTEAAALLAGIASYNEADCVSTLRLRDWLLTQAALRGVTTRGATAPAAEATEPTPPHPGETKLLEYVGDPMPQARGSDRQAAALMAAALGYHRRERKPFWWGHFDRLSQPVDEWADTRDTLVAAAVTLERDWHTSTPRQRKQRRHLTLTGELATGSTIRVGTDAYVLYDPPAPPGLPDAGALTRGYGKATVTARTIDESFRDVVEVEEFLATGVEEYAELPMALAPGPPIHTRGIEQAIEAAAERMCQSLPQMPPTAATDVLRRVPPRTRSSAPLPVAVDGDYVAAITAAVLDLDDSYLAVQGPPGTGKTHTAARVIADLVSRHHWKIGVVAQSHSVVENLLDKIVDAGVPGDKVAKAKAKKRDPAWTPLEAKQFPSILESAAEGCVIGGTAWDFTNTRYLEPGCLDLLVIDEAGQFSLANTVAVAMSSRNLLLLGDPQQLPQVSQGTHPEPVDESVLGWLAEGHGTLPADRGYFLARTWRMHPQLCERVSHLSYEGRLRSQDTVTSARSLDNVEPGVRTVFVDHHGNSTASEEEAAEVVRQVQAVLGAPWRDPQVFEGVRALEESDALVVAPYNAQVNLIKTHLERAGLTRVDVGTVDKFQGREAAVVVMSMTASAIEDVPRGMSFLLSRHRLNVAVSRGKWAAIVIRSHALTHYLPATPQALTELGAFLLLTST